MESREKNSWVPILAVVGVMLAIGFIYVMMRSTAVEAPPRMPTRFVLPSEFSGSVKVYYNVAGKESLREEDGFRIVEVPPSGIVVTSSEPLYGRATDEFVRLKNGDESETLGYHYIRDRKMGLTGDNKEYFLRPEEMEQRDTELVRHGIVDERDGTPKYGVPYELFTVRDDF